MSVINKMHQGLQEHRDDAPILSSMPPKKQNKKVLLFVLIALLLSSSIALSYLIYARGNARDNAQENAQDSVQESIEKSTKASAVVISPTAQITPVSSPQAPLKHSVVAVKPDSLESTTTPVIQASSGNSIAAESEPATDRSSVAEVLNAPASLPQTPLTIPVTTKIEPTKPAVSQISKPVPQPTPQRELSRVASSVEVQATEPHLEIKTSQLNSAQLADIHLNNAQKAAQQGDRALAAKHKMSALNLQPQLHDVRQSLALYYYALGDQKQAKSLLQKGALQFPEHADFNLMLARIALKNSDPQRAYFYLRQAPPEVAGNIDYHVSYAILAQKFKQYEQAEQLYQGLLTQRPNNGRWLMSLAIAQDKQGKEALAVQSYQGALLQVDLSSKAKQYINQRLTYLANQ